MFNRLYSLIMVFGFLTFSVQNIALESKTAESDLSAESDTTDGTPVRAGLPKRNGNKKYQKQVATPYSPHLQRVSNLSIKLKVSTEERIGLPQRFKAVLGQNGLGRSLNT